MLSSKLISTIITFNMKGGKNENFSFLPPFLLNVMTVEIQNERVTSLLVYPFHLKMSFAIDYACI